MKPIDVNGFEYILATVTEIDEEEYIVLKNAETNNNIVAKEIDAKKS
jgi:hypothetical protein